MADDATVDEALIAHLYSGALHDGDWSPALERLLILLRCKEISLAFVRPAASPDDLLETYATGNILNPENISDYTKYYSKFDPKKKIFARRRTGFLFNDIDYFDDDFVRRDTFYQEFSRPVGSRHTLDALISRTPVQEVYLASMRSARQGHYDSSAMAVFQQAYRHFSKVVELRRSITAAARAIDHVRAGLDALAFGMIVLDEDGRVVTANAAAVRACSADEGLSLANGCLSTASTSANQAFGQAVGRCMLAEGGTATTLRAPRPNGQSWMISVVPLPLSSAISTGRAPGALVLIGDGDIGRGVRREDLAAVFGLTLAEAELAIMLGGGGSLTEVARRRGVKISTARSQLHSILQKMQVQRQSDLVRAVAALPMALLS